MPRGRMLNKKISIDEKVAELSLKSALLFTWCIPHLDVGGKILGNPDYLKGVVVPYRKDFNAKVIEKCLQEIQEKDLIIIYGNSHKYIYFKGFEKNQSIDPNKEAKSLIPDPTPELLQSNSRVTLHEVNNKEKEKEKEKESLTHTHPLAKWILENLSQVSKLEKQMKDIECEKILEEYPEEVIKKTLMDMENYKPLLKKYKSVYLTLRKWINISMKGKYGYGTNQKGNINYNKYANELKTERQPGNKE